MRCHHGPVRRTLLLVVAGALVALTPASPAAAHSVAGAGATNYLARLHSVEPPVPGIEVRVVEHGSRVEMTNTSDEDVVVLGYRDEPYLRVGPDGVFENARSPATYINRERTATADIPRSADPEAAPEWRKVSDGRTARWHDHRMHHMGQSDPPAVRDAPGERHVVTPEWTVTMRHGDTTIRATGDLVWVPGPSPVPWLAVAALLAIATAAVVITASWAPALAAITAVLVVIDVAHVVGTAAFAAGSFIGALGDTLGGSVLSLIGWAAGAATVGLLARHRPEGLFAAGVAGVSIAVNGGLADLADLSRSQLPFAWPDVLGRAAVVGAIGLGLGLVVAAFLGVARHPVTLEAR